MRVDSEHSVRAHWAARSPSVKEPKCTWRPFFRPDGAELRDCQMCASQRPVLLYLRRTIHSIYTTCSAICGVAVGRRRFEMLCFS